jgi:hypothetical protein
MFIFVRICTGVKPIQLFTCGKRILHVIKLLSVRPSTELGGGRGIMLKGRVGQNV